MLANAVDQLKMYQLTLRLREQARSQPALHARCCWIYPWVWLELRLSVFSTINWIPSSIRQIPSTTLRGLPSTSNAKCLASA